jgi:hypothetical protein
VTAGGVLKSPAAGAKFKTSFRNVPASKIYLSNLLLVDNVLIS